MRDFKSVLAEKADYLENFLEEVFSSETLSDEVQRPDILMQAIRHSALDGGKRLRPFLLMETAALFGVPTSASIHAAAALECIHCYSLVHDDLPAMDDDDLRRGKPTTHKAFDEATAILAGDALLTFAFDLLSRQATQNDPAIDLELVRLFSRCAGLGGMVGGQVLDLQAETIALSEAEILNMQSMKTGALIRCACEAGAILGKASAEDRTNLRNFGTLIGQAFQLVDDLLDVTADTATMGKKTAKDADRGKGTLVSLYGIENSRKRADDLLVQAVASLAGFGKSAKTLEETARFVINRKN